MTQLNEEHFELHDANKAKRYPEQKIKKARDTLREILKVYHNLVAKILGQQPILSFISIEKGNVRIDLINWIS